MIVTDVQALGALVLGTEAEKTLQPQGAFLLTTNRGTTGFSWTLERWQAVAPTAWYIFVSNQDNVLALL